MPYIDTNGSADRIRKMISATRALPGRQPEVFEVGPVEVGPFEHPSEMAPDVKQRPGFEFMQASPKDMMAPMVAPHQQTGYGKGLGQKDATAYRKAHGMNYRGIERDLADAWPGE